MPCRLNCTCKVCGRVRLHVTKTPRRAKPKPVDPATVALADAMRRVTLRPAEPEPGHDLARAFERAGVKPRMNRGRA